MSAKAEATARAVTALRVKDLLARVDRVRHAITSAASNEADLREPADIKAARARVTAWDAKRRAARDKAYVRASQRIQKVRHLVLYDDIFKAASQVEALESEARK